MTNCHVVTNCHAVTNCHNVTNCHVLVGLIFAAKNNWNPITIILHIC